MIRFTIGPRKVLSAFLLGTLVSTSVSIAQIEVFLLKPGLRYSYQYVNVQGYREVSYLRTTTDSGTVQYEVLDPTRTNDTTLIWSIRQSTSLRHTYHANFGGVDSLTQISDTSVVQLVESTTGYHELKCSSLVWKFPITFPMDSSLHIYRYADSSHLDFGVRFRVYGNWGGGYDTLSFSNLSGFSMRHRVFDGGGGMSSMFGDLYTALLSQPVVSVDAFVALPVDFLLHQNYPNPFNPYTTIRFDLPAPRHVTLRVFDLLGREVATLLDEQRREGEHTVRFDASRLTSGMYTYRLQAGANSVSIKKMLLLR